jgi:hypothetical protein
MHSSRTLADRQVGLVVATEEQSFSQVQPNQKRPDCEACDIPLVDSHDFFLMHMNIMMLGLATEMGSAYVKKAANENASFLEYGCGWATVTDGTVVFQFMHADSV